MQWQIWQGVRRCRSRLRHAARPPSARSGTARLTQSRRRLTRSQQRRRAISAPPGPSRPSSQATRARPGRPRRRLQVRLGRSRLSRSRLSRSRLSRSRLSRSRLSPSRLSRHSHQVRPGRRQRGPTIQRPGPQLPVLPRALLSVLMPHQRATTRRPAPMTWAKLRAPASVRRHRPGTSRMTTHISTTAPGVAAARGTTQTMTVRALAAAAAPGQPGRTPPLVSGPEPSLAPPLLVRVSRPMTHRRAAPGPSPWRKRRS